jgi:predicted naringenin-chalcone synthase
MRIYAEAAPALALAAIGKLERASVERVTHLVVASCTGFIAPGVDQIISRELGLEDSVERTLIGFMGCYAGIAALRTAYHIVRSQPAARVLVVTVELSTLHLQFTQDVEALLGMLQFGDGAAAALVTSEASGYRMARQFAVAVPDSDTLIQWAIGDNGFTMQLSGEVPGRIATALADSLVRERILDKTTPREFDSWAVHAGGRSILDAVQRAFSLPDEALDQSRDVLSRYGNMSSSTLLFVLAALLEQPEHRRGIALAFGPGLAAEGFEFERAA